MSKWYLWNDPETIKARKNRNRAIVREHKNKTPCKFCGTLGNADKKKIYNRPGYIGKIREMRAYGDWSIITLQEELEKRDVACISCYSKWRIENEKEGFRKREAAIDNFIEELIEVETVQSDIIFINTKK